MVEFVGSVFGQIIMYSTVYALAALGIVIAGRTGIFNIAGEGIMLAAAAMGYVSAVRMVSWVAGVAIGGAIGAVFALFLVFMHEQLKVNQFIMGIAIIILGAASAELSYKLLFAVELVAHRAPVIPVLSVPWLSQIPVVGTLFAQNVVTYMMYVAVIAASWIYYRTQLGLDIRSVGESPKAADVVGIPVFRYRYLATVIGGVLIGVAGAFVPLTITGRYSYGITEGRGFIAIGIAIFASWRPQRVFFSALVFAAFEVLSPQLQLLFPGFPFEYFLMIPFIGVLVIMGVFHGRVEFPASIGAPYERE